jgi:predicted DNA-binding transcriptional regulator AlpA
VRRVLDGKSVTIEWQRRLIDEQALSEYLGVPKPTLRKWRVFGVGPQHIKLGGKLVRYDMDAVDRWLDSRTRASTSDTGAEPIQAA